MHDSKRGKLGAQKTLLSMASFHSNRVVLSMSAFLYRYTCTSPHRAWMESLDGVLQQSKQDIDKPKVQSLEDILKELDEEDEFSDEDLEIERRLEELLAGEMVSCYFRCFG